MSDTRSVKAVVLLVKLLLVTSSQGFPSIDDPEDAITDVLMLTQQWPASACFDSPDDSGDNSESVVCRLPVRSEWIIEDLWSTKLSELDPSSCNGSFKFDPAAITSLRSLRTKQLKVPSKDSDLFWSKMWTKYESCSTTQEPFISLADYTLLGFVLQAAWDMQKVLERVDMWPGKSYSIDDIQERILQVVGAKGYVTCAYNEDYDEFYLLEISICFDHMFVPVDCDENNALPTECGTGRKIIYPTWMPIL